MNLPYFYEPLIASPHHILSEETSKHCVQVLRMKEDAQLLLTDGKGNLFTAVITKANKKNCEVRIQDAGYQLQDSNYNQLETGNRQPATSNVSIAISLLKNPTRFEWFLEKATEIGVKEIQPLICAHTEKENFRFDRMNNILISAMLQSKQTWLPQLHQPKRLDVFIKENFDGIKLIAHCKEENKSSINTLDLKNKNALLLIGPEGDFSQQEIDAALKNNFISVSLGNMRLRSETAGIVAATLLCNAQTLIK
jgi:16S rRNA (uracil1498-N3)-methyltransferase